MDFLDTARFLPKRVSLNNLLMLSISKTCFLECFNRSSLISILHLDSSPAISCSSFKVGKANNVFRLKDERNCLLRYVDNFERSTKSGGGESPKDPSHTRGT